MHAIRLAPAALFGVGALVLGAPAALTNYAGDGGRDSGQRASFGVHVTPSTVSAGGRVSLQLNRDDGCRGAATVSSDVFDTVRIPEGRDSVAATVHRDARTQASYRVTFDCDGTRGSTELSIAGSRSEEHGDGGTDTRADGQSEGRTDNQSEGRTDGHTDGQSDSRTDEHADAQSGSHTDAHADAQSGSHTDAQSDDSTDERTDGRTDGGADGGADGQSDSRTDGREELNPQPLPPDRGVRAGAGGSVGGFDPKEIGLGAALVVASVGTAYRIARRRPDEGGA
ncbi:hypothetical protein ACGFZQ_33125 [Streptomyces sp. NPDC048254]|uniref:hypothetical protein n=1 Tax=Streptomyces sp. NPDC048254 TaxID=3365525 RepID=UPI003711B9D3